MNIKSTVAAAGMLALVPVAAGALSVTLFEGTAADNISATIVDGGTTGSSTDLNPNDGVLEFIFDTGNFSGQVTATTTNINGVVTFSLIGSATLLNDDAATLPLTFLASDSSFTSPFDPLTVKLSAESGGTGDSAVSIAAFLSATNNGGAGDATDLTTVVTSSTLLASGATESATIGASFLATNRISVTPNDPFAINQIVSINEPGGLGLGDTTSFAVTSVATVPVPAPLVLLLSALGGLGFMSRSRRAKA